MDKRSSKKYALAAAAFFALLLLPQVMVADPNKGNTDTELDSFVAEIEAVSKEIAVNIESDQTGAGMDTAQKIFDGKKEYLRERTRQFTKKEAGVSEASLKKLFTGVINSSRIITEAFAKNASVYAGMPASIVKFQHFINDYFAAFCRAEFDDFIESFIEDFDAVSKEMAAKIDKIRGVAGLDAAQKAFNAKKAALKEKFAMFRNARGMQVSEMMLKKLTDSIINNGKAITDAFSKHAADYSKQRTAIPRFQKLMKDYTDTFSM